MAWGGQGEVTALVGGRHGGYVLLGDAMVPRRLRLEMDGANGAPDLKMLLELRDGRPECVEITVTAKPDGRGIAAKDLQVLQRRLGTLTAELFAQLAAKPFYRQRDGQLAGAYGRLPADRRRRLERDLYEARASRRGKVTRAELEEVARVYREHVAASPTRAVFLLLGYESERTAARRVQQARAAGLLPKTTSGKRKA